MARPKKSQRDDAPAKLDKEVLRQAKTIATWRGITIAEYLTEILRSPVRKDFEELVSNQFDQGKRKK